jgi:DtxR family transcriptional regulator, Mn-dependent transcriptional regulator
VKRQAPEDYLKAIYTLSESIDRVSTSALAGHLGVKPSSVTAMVKKLGAASPPLLDYRSHRGVALTEAGQRIALEVTRRHRLIEQFLVVMMGFGWDEVHEEADRLEHCVSDAFIDRLDRLLDYPRRDPHGRPIPTPNGEIPELGEILLSEAAPNETVRVSGVASEAAAFLRYLMDIGLTPEATVRITEIDAAGEVIHLEMVATTGDPRRVIARATAEKVFVTPVR